MSVVYEARYKDFFYIGKAKDLSLRKNVHIHHFKKGNKSFCPFVGLAKDFEEIEFKVIHEDKDEEQIKLCETVFICAYRADDKKLLNKVNGKSGVRKHSEKSKIESEKIRNLKRVEEIKKTKSYKKGLEKAYLSRVKNLGLIKVTCRKTGEIKGFFKNSEQAAKLLGVSFGSICRYIRGDRSHKEYDFERGQFWQ